MGRPRVELHDPGLQRRMLLTLCLLAAVYGGLVAALVLSGIGAAIVGGIAMAIVGAQLLTGDRLVLRVIGAREVQPDERPELHAAVDRVCIEADMPKPRLAVAASAMPNALAVGRTRGGATLCVTTQMLHVLEPAELEAVVAHELAHIQNRDALVMTIASFFSLVAGLIVRFVPNVHAAVRIVTLAVSLAAWALSAVLLRSLSRYRELAADRAAALVTGRPSALASALMKLDAETQNNPPKKDLRAVESVAALCVVPARAKSRFARLVATHPTTERRVAALEALEGQLQRSGPRQPRAVIE
jgi:heat shock protein HtpX